MPKLDDLPVEIAANVASFIEGRKYNNPQEFITRGSYEGLRELLALRCASRSCKDAVRRSAAQYKEALEDHIFFGGSSAESIAAMGRVFGSGCRSLTFGRIKSEECVRALENFVTSTKGQLRHLSSLGGPSLCSMPAFLRMCRASPLLTSLMVHGAPTGIITAANLDDFASAVGSACPLLETIWLPRPRSPAEDYLWRFPRAKSIDLSRRLRELGGPICYENIELTLRTCVHAVEVDFAEIAVTSQLVDLILGAPVAGQLTALNFSCGAEISPELVLRFARGLEMLTDLQVPPYDFDGETQFYRSLVQARPAIVRLDLGFANSLDNEDLRFICHSLRLEHLDLSFNDISLAASHPNAIDVIVESPCAQTLRSINLCQLPFISEELLQLLRGCPKLAKLEWEAPEEDEYEYLILSPIEDGPEVDAINALLKSRGGEAIAFFEEYGPKVRPPGH